jgi:hypothetical protein
MITHALNSMPFQPGLDHELAIELAAESLKAYLETLPEPVPHPKPDISYEEAQAALLHHLTEAGLLHLAPRDWQRIAKRCGFRAPADIRLVFSCQPEERFRVNPFDPSKHASRRSRPVEPQTSASSLFVGQLDRLAPFHYHKVEEQLDSLEAIDPRQANVVELRFFAGLDIEETAVALGVSEQTVIRDWELAESWLLRAMKTK